MQLIEIRPRLWRWTAPHPEWNPGARPESPSDWPREVGSVAYRAPGELVLIDPQLPEAHRDSFLAELDALVAGGSVRVLTTIKFHRRSRDQLAERYGASTSRARSSLPDGVRTVPIRGAGEVMVWLPEPRALVPGDRLIGDGSGGLRLCPESWLSYLGERSSLRTLREALRPLSELPIEIVLPSHGEPVLGDGGAAVATAIGAPT